MDPWPSSCEQPCVVPGTGGAEICGGGVGDPAGGLCGSGGWHGDPWLVGGHPVGNIGGSGGWSGLVG